MVEGNVVKPKTTRMQFKTDRKVGKVGVMLVGLGGNNGWYVNIYFKMKLSEIYLSILELLLMNLIALVLLVHLRISMLSHGKPRKGHKRLITGDQSLWLPPSS